MVIAPAAVLAKSGLQADIVGNDQLLAVAGINELLQHPDPFHIGGKRTAGKRTFLRWEVKFLAHVVEFDVHTQLQQGHEVFIVKSHVNVADADIPGLHTLADQ